MEKTVAKKIWEDVMDLMFVVNEQYSEEMSQLRKKYLWTIHLVEDRGSKNEIIKQNYQEYLDEQKKINYKYEILSHLCDFSDMLEEEM